MRHILPLFIILFVFTKNVCSQGNPFIKNFAPSTYSASAQNWCVVQDKRGVIYVANNYGLLVYNGINWDGIELPKSVNVWSAAIDKNDKLYVGGINEFGTILPDSRGTLKYQSLSKKLPENYQNFKDVWSIYTLNDEVIFFTPEYIFIYKNDAFTIVKPINDQNFHKMFLVGKELIVRNNGIGLLALQNNKLVKLKNTELFSNIKVDFIIDNSQSYLIGTRNEGMFKYDKLTAKLEEVNNETSRIFKSSEIYHACELHDGNIAVASKLDGVFFIDKNGNLLEHINRDNKLIDNNVWYVYEDMYQNIWAATDKGISIISHFIPFRIYDESANLFGNVNASIKYKNDLYVLTSQMFCKKNEVGKFELITKKNGNALVNFIYDNDRMLLAGCKDGLFLFDGKGLVNAEQEPSNLEIFTILQSKYDKKRLFIGANNAFAIYRFNGRNFELTNYIELEGDARSITEDAKGNVFIGIETKGVITFNVNGTLPENLDSIAEYLNFENFESSNSSSSFNLINFNNLLLTATNNGIYKLEYDGSNVKNGKFKIYDVFDQSFNNRKRDIFRTYNDSHNRLWLASIINSKNEVGILAKNSNGTFSLDGYHFSIFHKTQTNSFFVEPSNYAWISTNDGLVKYDFSKPIKKSQTFYSVINRVITNKNDTIFGGYYFIDSGNTKGMSMNQPKSMNFEVKYSNNGLRFEFAATSFINTDELRFKTFLENYEDGFTEWNKDYQRSFTNLTEGDYVFHVIAKDVYGNISKETTFAFTIKTPWYRHIIAYIIYLIIAYYLIREIVKYNTKRLMQQNLILEGKVQERTHEIAQQKTEIEKTNIDLALKNKIVEQKNKDITDSINYAQKIQLAILPEEDDIKSNLNDFFILLKPRDVVSGDFYWYQPIGKGEFLIAVADCTGHGVPGALMSMLGSNLLEQIINEKGLSMPDEILYHLNLGIAESLQQNKNAGNDGMDIAICKININTLELQYAGANRPLYLVSNNELIDIKPTKLAIGGQQKEEVRKYQLHTLNLKKGDCIYFSTDGYADQFGGPKGKKLTTTKFKELVLSNHQLPMNVQKKFFAEYIENWRGSEEQVDDICIVGICI